MTYSRAAVDISDWVRFVRSLIGTTGSRGTSWWTYFMEASLFRWSSLRVKESILELRSLASRCSGADTPGIRLRRPKRKPID